MDEGTLARLASGLPVPVESIPVYDLPFLTLNMCVLLVITHIYVYVFIYKYMYVYMCIFRDLTHTHTNLHNTNVLWCRKFLAKNWGKPFIIEVAIQCFVYVIFES